MSHTPGPWRMIRPGTNKHYCNAKPGDYEYAMQQHITLQGSAANDGDHFVADLILDSRRKGLDNALLIAAAPDLYEACKELVEVLHPGVVGLIANRHGEEAKNKVIDAIHAAARAFLKAEGKQ